MCVRATSIGLLVVCQVLSGAWGAGAVDCSAPSAGVLSLQEPMDTSKGWHDGSNVVVEGVVRAIGGRRTFLIQVST